MEPFKEDAEDLRLTVVLLRSLRGWTQGDLADAAGISPSVISDYERGKRRPPRGVVDRLAETVGLSRPDLDRFLPALCALRRSMDAGPGKALQGSVPPLEELALSTAHLLRIASEMLLSAATGRSVFPPDPEDRLGARELWNRLQEYNPEDRRLLVEIGQEYQRWALCELLCHESAGRAAEDPDLAAELADLALLTAELATGSSHWRHRLQGYAWGHVGNARRSRGDLPGAAEAFRRAEALWRAGASAEPDLLDKWRLLALEPSLDLGEEDET